ncbi:MAG: ABC transporter ATP-binding protein [Hamadaea sp.]|nr:ABC transporter ATP-binding protein [Hamadaea sp.]
MGRVCGLVGPNGAGKSTLMALSAGLLRPTVGTVRVLGTEPGRSGAHPKVAFLAQDKPLYRRFTVEEMLRAGRALNVEWDQSYVERLVQMAGVRMDARIGTLSGGQRTRVALAVALGRRPMLLMLDEPLADLDPLAREEVLRTVMSEVAETGMTVLLSSHVLADMEGICDHLLLLAGGRVHLAGGVEDLIAGHRVLIGLHRESGHGFPPSAVVESRTTGRQQTVLIRAEAQIDTGHWDVLTPTLEELAMAYLRTATAAHAIENREVPVA